MVGRLPLQLRCLLSAFLLFLWDFEIIYLEGSKKKGRERREEKYLTNPS